MLLIKKQADVSDICSLTFLKSMEEKKGICRVTFLVSSGLFFQPWSEKGKEYCRCQSEGSMVCEYTAFSKPGSEFKDIMEAASSFFLETDITNLILVELNMLIMKFMRERVGNPPWCSEIETSMIHKEYFSSTSVGKISVKVKNITMGPKIWNYDRLSKGPTGLQEFNLVSFTSS